MSSFDWPSPPTASAIATMSSATEENQLISPQENELTTLTHSIIEWRRLKVDNDAVKDLVRERTKKMKALEEIIVRVMKSHNIGALDLKNSGGRVLFRKQKCHAGLGCMTDMSGPGKKDMYMDVVATILALLLSILIIAFVGKYLWNTTVAELFTFARPVQSVWQIIGLMLFISLVR